MFLLASFLLTDSHWYRLPDWWLVIVGAWTGFAVWRQAKESTVATQVMRDSLAHQKNAADAALLNAKAVIQSQRPWVTFFAMHYSSTGTYSFRAGNMGKSPARVISYSSNLFYEHPSKLPNNPDYGLEQTPRLDFLTPGETPEDQSLEIRSVEPRFLMFQDSERAKRLNERIEAVIVILKIVYEDLANPDPNTNLHETRMCFDWTPGMDFKISGPPEYNRHT